MHQGTEPQATVQSATVQPVKVQPAIVQQGVGSLAWGGGSSDRSLLVLLCLSILVLPFLFMGGAEGVRAAKVLGFVLCTGLLWSVMLWRWARPCVAVAVACSIANAVYFGFGPIHATALVVVLSASVLVVVSRQLLPAHAQTVLTCIAVAGSLQALYGYLQMSGYEIFFARRDLPDKWVPVGFLGQQTLLGPFLVACAVAAWGSRPWLAWVMIPAIIATGSSMTLLSATVAAGILALPILLKHSSVLWAAGVGVLLLFGALAIYGFPLAEDNGRLALWSHIGEIALRRPWFGFGLGTFHAIYPTEQPEHLFRAHGYFLQAHNEYLQIFFELGVVGLLVTGWMCLDYVRIGLRTLEVRECRALFAMGAALLVNALGSFPFHVVPSAMVLLIAWGGLMGHSAQVRECVASDSP